MAKRTIKRAEAAEVKKPAAAATPAASGGTKTARAKAPRAAKAPGFVPPTPEEIAERAYYRAMERGFTPGNAMEDWLAAEADLLAWRQAASQPTKTASRKKVERATGIEPV